METDKIPLETPKDCFLFNIENMKSVLEYIKTVITYVKTLSEYLETVITYVKTLSEYLKTVITNVKQFLYDTPL